MTLFVLTSSCAQDSKEAVENWFRKLIRSLRCYFLNVYILDDSFELLTKILPCFYFTDTGLLVIDVIVLIVLCIPTKLREVL